MAYENLTTFTEVDPSSHWSQTATRNTAFQVARNENSYVYKDYGVDFFGDYEHWFDLRITGIESGGGTGDNQLGMWAVTNSPAKYGSLFTGQYAHVYHDSGTSYIIYLWDAGLSNWDSSGWSFNDNTTYYLKVSRVGTTATLIAYPTANDRINNTNAITTLTVTCQNTTFRYLQVGMSAGTTAITKHISGYMENFDLESLKSENILANLKATVSTSKDVSFYFQKAVDIKINLKKEGISEILNIAATLKDTISFAKNILFSLLYAPQFAKDILSNLKKTILNDENIVSNLKTTVNVSKDIISNLSRTFSFNKTININLKKEIYDAYNIGAVLAKEDIYDFDSDIRWKLEQSKNIGFALSLPVADIQPAGLDEIKVYVNDVLLPDVDIRTVEWTWTMNDRPGTCSFLVARKFDAFNDELDGTPFSLAVDQVIKIKFNGTLKYYGYIINLDVSANRETVIVRGMDRKYKIAKELFSKDYGRYSVSGYDRTGAMLTYILGDLVTKGHILSYSGVPTGIVPELREQDGVPYGTLITELLEQSGNYKWNVTPAGVLEIYKQGDGVLKEISYQEYNRQIGLYDIIDCRFTLNDISNMITTAEIVMGTLSVETYDSYKRVFLNNVSLYEAWNPGDESSAKNELLENINMMLFGTLFGDPNRVQNSLMDVYRRYFIPSWTDGSFIDTTVKPFITQNTYDIAIDSEMSYTWRYRFTTTGSSRSYGGDWRIEDGYVYFSNPRLMTSSATYDIVNDLMTDLEVTQASSPRLTMAFYKKETIGVATYPTIFDVTYIGTGGSGYKRRFILPDLGVAAAVYWNEYLDGKLVWHYKPGYNDTAYATDRAKLFLSRVNDPITQGNFSVTLDAQDYFGLDLGKRVNIINTEEVDIYRNKNNFPIDIEEIRFNAGTYLCTVSGRNRRSYVCSVDKSEIHVIRRIMG